MLGRYLAVVGEDQDGPAFVQEMEEFAQIVVCLFVEVFHPFFCHGNRVAVEFMLSHMLDEHMLF